MYVSVFCTDVEVTLVSCLLSLTHTPVEEMQRSQASPPDESLTYLSLHPNSDAHLQVHGTCNIIIHCVLSNSAKFSPTLFSISSSPILYKRGLIVLILHCSLSHTLTLLLSFSPLISQELVSSGASPSALPPGYTHTHCTTSHPPPPSPHAMQGSVWGAPHSMTAPNHHYHYHHHPHSTTHPHMSPPLSHSDPMAVSSSETLQLHQVLFTVLHIYCVV